VQTSHGWEPEELLEPRLELVHLDDRVALSEVISRLFQSGGATQVTFRFRHRSGHYVWIEALAGRVQKPRSGSGAGNHLLRP